jgi:hypothetical protein
MGRQHAALGLADVASGAGARVPGCWGKHLRGSEPPEDKGGCTVSRSRETTVTRQRAGQTRSPTRAGRRRPGPASAKSGPSELPASVRFRRGGAADGPATGRLLLSPSCRWRRPRQSDKGFEKRTPRYMGVRTLQRFLRASIADAGGSCPVDSREILASASGGGREPDYERF